MTRSEAYAASLCALDGYFMPDRCSMEKLKARDEIYFAAMNLADAAKAEVQKELNELEHELEMQAIDRDFEF